MLYIISAALEEVYNIFSVWPLDRCYQHAFAGYQVELCEPADQNSTSLWVYVH